MNSKRLSLFLCGLVALASLATHWQLEKTRRGVMPGQVDFSPSYISAKLLLAGERQSVYGNEPYGSDRDLNWMAEERALPEGHYDTVFSYMPAYLIPMLPLAYAFDYLTIIRLLGALNIGLAALLCASLAVRFTDRPHWQLLLAGLLAHAHVITETIDLGQNMLLAGGFIYLFFEAVDRNRTWAAILFFLLAAISKPWAFLFGGYALVHRKYLMVVYLGASLAIIIGVQALLEPELFAGYLELSSAHSKIAVLAHNNVAFTAGLHRLLLDDWIQYVGWFDAGAAPFFLLPLKLALASLTVFVGWRTDDAKVKRRSVLVAVFVMLNVYWDYYMVLFLPLLLADLRPFSKNKIPLLALGAITFFWSQIALYPFFHAYFYRFFPGGATGTIVAAQLLAPTALVLYLFINALAGARTESTASPDATETPAQNT